ncbi:DUF3631 domain-containing protein [Mycolicibacterium fortuitum]|uniref:DUF3631 domain-containing protein n=1 Tax=Mycolicibacterium fortuitum TaxID=1766 RepID=UPI001CDBF855|nr:DUF3631 domain-containing protein [Mycolicibacterium fortuitum]
MTAKLLDQVNAMVNKYVAFPSEHHSVVVALWVLHTWTVNAFYVTPRLILDSAEPGSGKTRVLELLALLCRSAKLTLSTTTAALYRRIAAAQDEGLQPPTVLQDEADAIFGKTSTPQAEDLRALFNAGYRKGATVDRCEGDAKNMKVREFPVHAPVALAGLAGRMPDTIRTRGVTLHMRRRRPDQKVSDFRERDAQAEVAPIREQLETWAGEQEDLLAAARPKMPAGVTDRAAEIWEPLIAIADLAGDGWATKARAACTYFVVSSASDDERLSLGQRLLRDIKQVFDNEAMNAMWSSDIIAKLTSDPESEWRDLWGKTLDQRRLAKELARYGVKSKSVRIGVATSKGYDIDGPTGLRQAWDHWLTPSVSGTSGTSDTSQVTALRTVPDSETNGTSDTQAAQALTPSEQGIFENVPSVPDVPPTDGSSLASAPKSPRLCPDCQRAPARTDSGYCDFCTAKRRRQQTRPMPTRTALDFIVAYITAHGGPDGWVGVSQIYAAGIAEGHTREALKGARLKSTDPRIESTNTGRNSMWRIAAEGEVTA